MGFIPSSSTVSVEAKLTAAGRKKLFDSLETVNEPFITKFALGDSDCNYDAIDDGFGALGAGYVPQPGEWKPRIRSFLLQSGMYKPAVAHIVVDGRYGGAEGHYRTFPIGANSGQQQKYKFETEWPKGERYEEEYEISYNIAGANNIADIALFSNSFNVTFIANEQQSEGDTRTDVGELWLTFRGGMDLASLQEIIGPDDETNNGWTFEVRIEGQESQVVTVLNIDFVQ
jgi:hypothetical protein